MSSERAVRWGGVSLLLLAILGLGLYYQFDIRWRDYGTGDWLAYWSIPRGLLLGRGYFDGDWLRPMQVALGYGSGTFGGMHEEEFWPLWNPPPIVTLLMPLGALSFTTATLLWQGLSALLYGDAALRFNRALPRPLPPLVVLPFALLFLPFFVAMFWGQVTPLLAAFIIYAWLAQRRGHHAAAGVLLVPILLKPHLLLIAIGLILLVALRHRQWPLLGSFGGLTLALVVIAFALDPQWVRGWAEQGSPIEWQSFSLTDVLKSAFDLPDWFQFLGIPLAALVTLLRYHRVQAITPRLLAESALLSIAFSPYLWHHDIMVILPAALWVGAELWARGMRLPLAAQTALNVWLMPPAYLSIRFLPYMILFLSLWYLMGRPAAPPPSSEETLTPQAS